MRETEIFKELLKCFHQEVIFLLEKASVLTTAS